MNEDIISFNLDDKVEKIVRKRASLRILPNVKDPETECKMVLSKSKSSKRVDSTYLI